MAETRDFSEADIIISRFGGLTAMSRALGHKHPTTVQGWKEEGRIPYWRRHEIIEAAKRDGVVLPRGFRRNDRRAA